MTFYDWFDPHDHTHRKAYRELQETGCWPKAFWDEAKQAVDGSALYWSQNAQYKMADAWLTATKFLDEIMAERGQLPDIDIDLKH